MAQEGLTKDFGDLGGRAAAWLNGVSRKRKVGLQYVCLIGGFFDLLLLIVKYIDCMGGMGSIH